MTNAQAYNKQKVLVTVLKIPVFLANVRLGSKWLAVANFLA
jgi:hypothetical protein